MDQGRMGRGAVMDGPGGTILSPWTQSRSRHQGTRIYDCRISGWFPFTIPKGACLNHVMYLPKSPGFKILLRLTFQDWAMGNYQILLSSLRLEAFRI
jgi:hypothetical protein